MRFEPQLLKRFGDEPCNNQLCHASILFLTAKILFFEMHQQA